MCVDPGYEGRESRHLLWKNTEELAVGTGQNLLACVLAPGLNFPACVVAGSGFFLLWCGSCFGVACWLLGFFFAFLGFLASWLVGFLASWLPGFSVFWLLGFLASCFFWLLGFLAVWLRGFLASWLFGFWQQRENCCISLLLMRLLATRAIKP